MLRFVSVAIKVGLVFGKKVARVFYWNSGQRKYSDYLLNTESAEPEIELADVRKELVDSEVTKVLRTINWTIYKNWEELWLLHFG